jgi:hypothetical protein
VKLRNCAWIASEVPPPARPVWARGGAVTYQCPKSLITAESLSFLESFQLLKRIGWANLLDVDARTAEAVLILEDVSRNQDR